MSSGCTSGTQIYNGCGPPGAFPGSVPAFCNVERNLEAFCRAIQRTISHLYTEPYLVPPKPGVVQVCSTA